MLARLKQRSQLRRIAADLYGAIVSASRVPELYSECGAPDTPMGRLEVILVHMSLVIERLQQAGEDGQKLAQVLAEVYLTDMDDNLREIGIGDMGVPHRVKQAAGALYERHRRYSAAWNAADKQPLAEALAAHGLGTPGAPQTQALVGYVLSQRPRLESQLDADLLAGRIELGGYAQAP